MMKNANGNSKQCALHDRVAISQHAHAKIKRPYDASMGSDFPTVKGKLIAAALNATSGILASAHVVDAICNDEDVHNLREIFLTPIKTATPTETVVETIQKKRTQTEKVDDGKHEILETMWTMDSLIRSIRNKTHTFECTYHQSLVEDMIEEDGFRYLKMRSFIVDLFHLDENNTRLDLGSELVLIATDYVARKYLKKNETDIADITLHDTYCPRT